MSAPRRHAARGTVLAVLGFLLTLPATSSGHVLDQYLQASRIELLPDCITVEIDLTPGVEIAPWLFLKINANHDGRISDQEGRAYASEVLADVMLTVDDRRAPLVLIDSTFPEYDVMRAGTGTIRLRLASRIRVDQVGDHQIVFANRHQADRSVYLINAIMPARRDISITRQERDPLQQSIRLDYTVSSAGAAVVAPHEGWRLPAVLGVVLMMLMTTYSRVRTWAR